MKRVLRTACMALLALVLCAGMAVPAARAASGVIATAQIPITIYMDGDTLPPSDTVTADIAAVTPGAPMPAASTLEIVCRGEKTQTAFSIGYTQLGVYQYTVTIHGGSYALAEYGEDKTFTITVAVTNNADYSGYQVEVGACEPGASTKCEVEDTNRYLTPLELKVVKKWVDQDSSRPASVSIDLLRSGEVVDTLVLRARNGWQGSFTGLDPRLSYDVKESKVPVGYTASYKFDAQNNIWYVTNTGSLLQTGQMTWPIPVLAIAGAALVVLGFAVRRGKREENG